jgi:hypothetical protein
MATITTRAGKGSPLTNTEVDDNFSNLNSAKYESGSNVSFGGGSFSSNISVGGTEANNAINVSRAANSSGVGASSISLQAYTTNPAFNWTGGTLRFLGSGNAIVFNEDSNDMDFRVESNDNANMLFVDASTNRVGVGTAAPIGTFNINGGTGDTATQDAIQTFTRTSSTGNVLAAKLRLDNYNTNHADLKFQVKTTASSAESDSYYTDALTLGGINGSFITTPITGGNAIFNQGGEDADFRVESNDNANMFAVNAGDNRVEINSGGNDENISLLVSAGVTQLNGHKFLKTAGWGAWMANTSYYLFTFTPESNGASGHATLNIGAGGVEHYAVFNLVARNASGTTTVAGYCTGASSSMFNLIGYRDNTDATKVHFYVKPTNNVYFTPRVSISGGGSISRLTNAPSSPVDEDYTISSESTYNHKLAAGLQVKVNSAYNDALVLRDARTSSDTSIRFKSNIEFLNYHNNSMIFGVAHNDYSSSYRRGFIKFDSTTNDANMKERVTITGGETVLNEESGDHDFRVEADSNTHALFVDAGANHVNIGTSYDAGGKLNIAGDIAHDYGASRVTYRGKYIDYREVSDGVYYGYLLLVPYHSGTATAGAAMEGTFIAHRGSSGTGNGPSRAQVWASAVYTDTVAWFKREGSPQNFQKLVRVTYDSVEYIALKMDQVNGGMHNGIYYDGWSIRADANFLFMARNTEISNESDYSKPLPYHSLTHPNQDQIFENNVTFNEAGFDKDFRVESDANSHMLFVDASANCVGIGTSAPDKPLVVKDDAPTGNTTIKIHNNSASHAAALELRGERTSTSADIGQIKFNNNTKNVAQIRSSTEGATNNGTLEFWTATSSANVVRRWFVNNAGNFIPGGNDAYDIGSPTNAVRNVYTGDLHLSNQSKAEGNEVDGTKGSWTVQEGADHLYLINRTNGKKYRFALEEIE